jgi:hypothetical protein
VDLHPVHSAGDAVCGALLPGLCSIPGTAVSVPGLRLRGRGGGCCCCTGPSCQPTTAALMCSRVGLMCDASSHVARRFKSHACHPVSA